MIGRYVSCVTTYRQVICQKDMQKRKVGSIALMPFLYLVLIIQFALIR